jgi:hypothetical protein
LDNISHLRANGGNDYTLVSLEYNYSLWVREDNLVEKAKRPEYGSALDARELYPNYKPKTFRETAEEYYSS